MEREKPRVEVAHHHVADAEDRAGGVAHHGVPVSVATGEAQRGRSPPSTFFRSTLPDGPPR
jgi:hypothetical protein